MRLRNIYVICKKSLDSVKAITGVQSTNNSGYINVSGWEEFLSIYDDISSIEYTKEIALEVVNSVPEIYRHQSRFTVQRAEWNKISNTKERLISCLVDVIRLYESMGLGDEEHMGIDIKLPKCSDFSDLKKCVDELEFILYKCPFFKVQGETLKFEGIDVGSMWIAFVAIGAAVGITSLVLNNIAVFVDKCMAIRSHNISVQQQKLVLNSMQMENDEKQKIYDGLNKVYQAYVDNIVTEMEKETGIELKNGEERGVVTQSFEKANMLFDKGMQIYSTIDSPREVKLLFEPLEMKYLSISDELKLLENKDEVE